MRDIFSDNCALEAIKADTLSLVGSVGMFRWMAVHDLAGCTRSANLIAFCS